MKVKKEHNIITVQSSGLKVNKPLTICFEYCSTSNIPTNKVHVKKVVEALKSFCDNQSHSTRNPHPLKGGSNNPHVSTIQKQYEKESIISLDVGQRNGKDGKYRLLYYQDGSVAKILNLFVDTH